MEFKIGLIRGDGIGPEIVGEAQRADGDALERQHHEVCRAAHVADLALAPFPQMKAQHVHVVVAEAHDLYGHGTRHVAVRHLHWAAQHAQFLVAPAPGRAHDVDLLMLETRMREAVHERAVVGEEEESLAVLVETPHGHEALAHLPAQEVGHGAPAERIRERGKDARRLVHEDRARLLHGRAEGRAVHRDAHGRGVYTQARLRHDASVHGHAPGGDHLGRMAARGHPAVRQHVLEPLFHGPGYPRYR